MPQRRTYTSDDVKDLASIRRVEDVEYTGLSASFDGTFQEVPDDRLTFVGVSVFAQTDGAAEASVQLNIEEVFGAGGSDIYTVASAPPELGAGGRIIGSFFAPIVPGGGYQLENSNDPAGANAVVEKNLFQL